MTERLASWYKIPPSLQGVQPFLLEDMLRDTLGLYQRLAAGGE